jgi:hypothetical protein
MTVWTVLLRVGKRRRKRYIETAVYARDRAEAIDLAMRTCDLRRVTVVSARPVEL